MRCNNCGWDNADNLVKCVKCNNTLQASEPLISKEPDKLPESSSDINKTIKGLQSDLTPWDEMPTEELNKPALVNCVQCGYPVRNDIPTCPKCGSVIPVLKTEPIKQTINPYTAQKVAVCSLKSVPRESEKSSFEINIEGNTELNRDNTEPANESLSKQIQAKLEYRDGEWYLTNPGNKLTFIKVNEEIKLKKGDIILMGDRMFEFDC